jgi:hypothetical protein
LGGIREALRVWVGTGGLGGGIAPLVMVGGAPLTGEAVGEGLTPGVILDRAGFLYRRRQPENPVERNATKGPEARAEAN